MQKFAMKPPGDKNPEERGENEITPSAQAAQRSRAEEELRQSEEKYRTILESIEDGYYETNLRGDLTFFNKGLCRMLDFSEDELRGMNNRDYQTPEEAAEMYRFFNRVYRTGIPVPSFDWNVVQKDGSPLTTEGSIHLVKNARGEAVGFRGILRDVTKRRRVELALGESEARFRSLVELSSDWFWEQDAKFRFVRLEGRQVIADGSVSGQNLLGKRRWEIGLEIDESGGWERHRALLREHLPFRDQIMHRTLPDGEKRYISVSGEPIFDERGRFKGYRGVGRDITEQKRAQERIKFLATHDSLTGLPNRLMFGEFLTPAIELARRHGRTLAALFIDLDRFKVINDTLGHAAGDKLLKEIAGRLRSMVRASDIVARMGGDEFVVLVQEAAPHQVAVLARKILSAIARPIEILGQGYRVTASIGICIHPTDAGDERSLMNGADAAMYLAKGEGRDNFQFYSEGIRTQTSERLSFETGLRNALENNEFLLHYQPKLDLKSGSVTGLEALLRWQHPEFGLIPPEQFIPLAEESGLIIPIGRWALRAACRQNMAWQNEGLPPMRMAVNLSMRQLSAEYLSQEIDDTLQEAGMPPELLELELTEGVMIHNPERTFRILSEIRKMGVRLAIDDFGIGYSSLGQLKHLPVDTLKVDRSFIHGIPDNCKDMAIMKAIITMAKALNLTVIAEGVETKGQEQFLREHNCDEIQGYLFSKPVSSEEISLMLRQGRPRFLERRAGEVI